MTSTRRGGGGGGGGGSNWRFIALTTAAVLGALLALALNPSTATAAATPDLSGMVQNALGNLLSNNNVLETLMKMPMFKTFFESKVATPACQPRLKKFLKSLDGLQEIAKTDKKEFQTRVRKAWCGLGAQCSRDIVASALEFVTPGSMVETFIKAQMGGGDIDLQRVKRNLSGLLQNYCDSVGGFVEDDDGDESAAASASSSSSSSSTSREEI